MLKNLLFKLTLFFLCNTACHSHLKMMDEISVIVNQDIFLKSDSDLILKINNLNFKTINNSEFISNNFKNEILNYLLINYIANNKENNKSLFINFYNANILKKINVNISNAYIKYHEIKNKINISSYELNSLSKKIFLQENNISVYLTHFIIPLKSHLLKLNDHIYESGKLRKNIVSLIKSQHIPEKEIIKYLRNHNIQDGSYSGWKNLNDLPKELHMIFLNSYEKKNKIALVILNNHIHIFFIHEMKYKKEITTMNHIRHIMLIPSSISEENSVYIKLLNIRNSIKSGKINFTDAAKKYSHDLKSSDFGGDLGWDGIYKFNSNIVKKIINLKKNNLTMPLRSSNGWHIIELIDLKINDNTYAKYFYKAYQILFEKKLSERIYYWLQSEYKSTYIQKINSI